MKKLFAIIIVCLMLFAVGGCQSKGTSNNNSTEIEWGTTADDAIVGAWIPDVPVVDEYVLFTSESTLRVVYGTVSFEADVMFGSDGNGNKSAYTEGTYLYGQWTYTVEDDVLTITYPITDENEETTFEDKVFRKTDYTPIELLKKENFKADSALVGEWTNDTYGDSYAFTDDGFVVFSQKIEDEINTYTTEIKHSYTIEDGTITLYYYKDNSGEEVVDTFDYTIDGTMLLIGESDYYLNGEGDPAASETNEIE